MAFARRSKKANAAAHSVISDTSVRPVGPSHTGKTGAVKLDAEAQRKEHVQKHVEDRPREDKKRKEKKKPNGVPVRFQETGNKVNQTMPYFW